MSFLKQFREVNKREILGEWAELTDMNQIDNILEESKNQPVAIFKHSTRCGISHHVKSTLEEDWDFDTNEIKVYYLDLLAYRPISNEVAQRLNVVHQSPQFILIQNGEATNDWSHYSISNKTIRELVK